MLSQPILFGFEFSPGTGLYEEENRMINLSPQIEDRLRPNLSKQVSLSAHLQG